jgi:hypothetical protein
MLRRIILGAVCFLSGLTAGCLQVETRIKLNENGSVTVTERLQFSKRLIDLADKSKDAKSILALLEREAVEKRVKRMGEGAKLVSHKVREAEGSSRESISVITLPHINNLRYVSPYLAKYKYPKHPMLKCRMGPVYKSGWRGHRPGEVSVRFTPASGERPPRRPKDWKPPKGPTPLDTQVYRDLQPMFKDMLKGLKLRLVFESYAPLRFQHYYRYRGARAGTREYDLIDFSAKDLDAYGGEFLANEEIMLELLRMRLGGGNITRTTKGHAGNLTLPVYHPHGTPEIWFRPSRHFFDKHFVGKTLHFTERQGGPRKADWKRDGYHPLAGKTKKPPPKTPPADPKPKKKPKRKK